MGDSLKTLLGGPRLVIAPGVFDLISARLADRSNAQALYLTGYGTVASYKGLPDAGLATYSDMLDRVEAITRCVRKPVIADADTGYGGLLNVQQTVRGYERAGAAAIQLEDQQFPKKCGHTANRQVTTTKAMINKIRVAVDARSSPEFLIIARTDALSTLGLDEALRRAEAYRRAGADVLFIESPETPEQMRRIGAESRGPLLANQVHGGRTPMLPPAQLKAMGYALAIYPATGLLAAAQALVQAYDALARGQSVDVPLYPFDAFNRMIGFEEVWEFERRYRDLLSEQW